MFKDSITPQEVCDLLNELIELDPTAIGALMINCVPCNEGIADHPTVQVYERHQGFTLGVLGLINGPFGIDSKGWGQIAYSLDAETWEMQFFVREESKDMGGCPQVEGDR